MATPAQIDANRRNARNSTGPRTPAGKARSSRNALRHGLASDQIVLDTESEADFQDLLAGYLDHYQPTDPVEQTLVEEAAVAAWRLRRIRALETVLFDYRFVLEEGLWDPRDRTKFDLNDPSWAHFRQAGALLHGPHGDDALERLSRYETRARRAFYAAITELRRRKAKPDPIEAIGRTQPSHDKSDTCGPIGFVSQNTKVVSSQCPRAAASHRNHSSLSRSPGTGHATAPLLPGWTPCQAPEVRSSRPGWVPDAGSPGSDSPG